MAGAANIPENLLSPTRAQDKVRPARIHPVLLGGVLCAMLAVVMTGVFQSQITENTVADARQRDVIMHGMALADIVGGIEAAGARESAPKLDELLTSWQSKFPDVSNLRVLRLSGAQLLASTNPADAAVKTLPRRLAREEKEIFDLAKELSAAVETNRDEGVSRKRQILLEPVGADSVNISLPYFTSQDGKVAGLVQFTKRVEPVGTKKGLAGAIIAVAVVAVLAYIAGRKAGNGSSNDSS